MIEMNELQDKIKDLDKELETAISDCKKGFWAYKNIKDNMIASQKFHNEQKEFLNKKGLENGKEQLKSMREATKIAYDTYITLIKRVSFIEGAKESLSLLIEDITALKQVA